MLREVVQLAAPHRVPVVAPGEDFGIQSLVESGREPRLSLLEAVQRNAHVHMVGAVLENVVDQPSSGRMSLTCTVVVAYPAFADHSSRRSYQATRGCVC